MSSRTAVIWVGVFLLLAVAGGGGFDILGSDDESPVQGAGVTGRVVRVVDGDTVKVRLGDRRPTTVRYIGVDTPEVYGDDECYGRQASAFVERTLPLGSTVRYRLGTEERDRYGRALAYVYLDGGRFLNLLLVRRGFAQVLTVPPNVEFAERFARAARRAHEAGRGLWGRPGCAR